MMVWNEKAKKYVRKVGGKPIGSGKLAGTMRSRAQGTDIQRVFKGKIGVASVYHKWA